MICCRRDAQQTPCTIIYELSLINFNGLLGIFKFPIETLWQRICLDIATQLNIFAFCRADNHHFIGGTNWYEFYFQ